MTPSKSSIKHSEFLASYRRNQQWSLPDSIIYYMAKNPSSAKVYQKLVKCCKYFYIKNPIIVIQHMKLASENKWKIVSKRKLIDFPNISTKFWLTEEINICYGHASTNVVSIIIPKFFRIDIKNLSLTNQLISFNEFLLLSSDVYDLYLNHVTVMDENGTVVTLEKIVESASKMKILLDNSTITKNTVKEILKIPHFLKIERFYLWGVSDIFDIETFYKYMKENKGTKIMLYFSASIPTGYKNQIKEIVDEILSTESHEYKPPYIYFNGIPVEKDQKMRTLFDNYKF